MLSLYTHMATVGVKGLKRSNWWMYSGCHDRIPESSRQRRRYDSNVCTCLLLSLTTERL